MAEYNNGFAVNTRLPEDIYRWLKSESKSARISMGLIVRQALLEAMKKNERPHKAKRKFPQR